MSIENLREYVQRCEEEPELRAQAREIGWTDVDAHMDIARSMGLDWTQGDMKAYLQGLGRREVGELADEDLEGVVGGMYPPQDGSGDTSHMW